MDDDTEDPFEEQEAQEDEDILLSFSDEPIILVLSILRQFCCCIIPIMLPYFLSFPLSVTETHWVEPDEEHVFEISGVYDIAGVVGCVFGGFSSFLIGRKLPIIAANAFSLFYLLIGYDALEEKKFLFPFSPMFIGFIIEFSKISCVIYIAEIASTTFRAFFLGLHLFSPYLVPYLINMLAEIHLKQLYLYWSIVSFFSSLLSLLIPESPFWLALHGKEEKAAEIFFWIKGYSWYSVEYDMMVDRVETIRTPKDIDYAITYVKTFVCCVLFSIIIIVCNASACDLQHVVVHYYYFGQKKRYYIFEDRVTTAFAVNDINVFYSEQVLGCVIFLIVNFVIPRKILYGLGFLITVLLLIPILPPLSTVEVLKTVYRSCVLVPRVAKEPLAVIMPLEVFPAKMRDVGVIIPYSFDKLYSLIRKFTESQTIYPFYFEKLPFGWTYFSYFTSIVGIPFLLIFMPETKGMNMYDLDDVTLKLPNIISFHEDDSEGEEEEF